MRLEFECIKQGRSKTGPADAALVAPREPLKAWLVYLATSAEVNRQTGRAEVIDKSDGAPAMYRVAEVDALVAGLRH